MSRTLEITEMSTTLKISIFNLPFRSGGRSTFESLSMSVTPVHSIKHKQQRFYSLVQQYYKIPVAFTVFYMPHWLKLALGSSRFLTLSLLLAVQTRSGTQNSRIRKALLWHTRIIFYYFAY